MFDPSSRDTGTGVYQYLYKGSSSTFTGIGIAARQGHKGKYGHASSVASSPDSKLIVAGNDSGVVWQVRVDNDSLISESKPPEKRNWIKNLSYHPKGESFLWTTREIGIKYPGSSKQIMVPGSPVNIKFAAYSPDGKYIYCGSQKTGVWRYDTGNIQNCKLFIPVKDGRELIISPDGKRVMARYKLGRIYLSHPSLSNNRSRLGGSWEFL